MSDPRNVAHDKKVIQEKKHAGEDLASGAAHVPQPGKKTAAAEQHQTTEEIEGSTAAEGHPPRKES